ncbi:MAG: SDR family oxidoreductase [Variibacter sp.]|nr:SDR family oxidoreductase [Variibacter sp.]
MSSEELKGRVAIVTGGGRGLGRAMTLGLVRAGATVVAAAHIAEDFEDLQQQAAGPGRLIPLVVDLRKAADCDRTVKAAQDAGGPDILVNNAGLTFTYAQPDRFRRAEPYRFWDMSDEVVENVMAVNVLAADRLGRRVAPLMIAKGWGRILNVTTMLQTMNRPGHHPYGPSKACLEMASEVWSKDIEGTGVTVNALNPGAGANTPGMADEMKERSRSGQVPRLLEAEEMVPPLLWLCSRAADGINGIRVDARLWNPALPVEEAARQAARPLGLVLKPATERWAGNQP